MHKYDFLWLFSILRDGFYIVPSDLELFKDNSSGETESGAKAADW